MSGINETYLEIQKRRMLERIVPQMNLYTEDELLMKAEKNEFSTEEREKLAEKKMAMKDGSYPIRNKADLANAVQAFGRAKDPEKVKKWIVKRARSLDALQMLPESWNITKAYADELSVIEDAIEKGIVDESVIMKAKSYPVGTTRKWGNNEYRKTNTGWELVKKSGKDYKEPKEETQLDNAIKQGFKKVDNRSTKGWDVYNKKVKSTGSGDMFLVFSKEGKLLGQDQVVEQAEHEAYQKLKEQRKSAE